MGVTRLNLCLNVFSSTDERNACLKNAGLTDQNGVYNGNLNICFGDELRIPSDAEENLPESDYYSLKLSGAAYDKGVYSPGTLKLTFTVKKDGTPHIGDTPVSLEEAVKNTFTGIATSLFGFNVKGSDGTSSDICYILRDYYLQSVRTVDSTGKSCVITWRSPDYLLTQERGCEVFEAKKFGQDIFAAKAGSVSLSEDGSVKMKYDCSPNRLLVMGYNLSTCSRDGHHKEDDEQVIGHDDEIIQPYLVRYNESVYDFLVRVAHRCGEFIYYECDEDGGKFCLGLPEDTVEHIVTGAGYVAPKKMPLCSYSDLGGEDEDATGFATDYMNNRDYVEDAGTYYDMQHTSDDFLYRLSEDDDPSASYKLKANSEITKLLSPIFTASDIISGLTAAASVLLQDVVNTYWLYKDKLHDQFESYREESEKSTSGFTDGLNNAFFHTVDCSEAKSGRHTVTIDYADSIPTVRIGDDIDLQDGLYPGYVISRVSGKYSYSADTASLEASNMAEAVPVMEVSGLNKLPRMAFPGAADIAHSVKASSMEAIVARTDDPLLLGRVKVRYPWQFNEDGEPSDSTDVPKTSSIPLSPWIRVATPFAGSPGSDGGVYFPHSVGEHVLLNYVDGNIERPYVAGSLYFREKGDDGTPEAHGPERGNFDDKDVTFYQTDFQIRSLLSAKGHGLMFKDTSDTSPLTTLIPFLGVIEQIVKAATGAESCAVDIFKGGGISLGDSTGVLSFEMDADKRNIDFSSNFGSVGVSAFTGITINVPNGDVEIEGKNVFIEAGNNLTLKAGTNIKDKRDGAYWGEMTGTLLASAGTEILSRTTGVDLSGCLDLSFLRCIMDIVLRPVEGTLRVHTQRNATVTAGSGEVMIPKNLLHENQSDDNDYTEDLKEAYEKTDSVIKAFFKGASNQRETLEDRIIGFQKALTNNGTYADKLEADYKKYIDQTDDKGKKEIISCFCKSSNALANAEGIYGDNAKPNTADPNDREYLKFLSAYEKVNKAHTALQKVAEKYKDDVIELNLLDSKLKKIKKGKVKKDSFGADLKKVPFGEDGWDFWNEDAEEAKKWKKQLRRDAVVQILLNSDKVRILRSKSDSSKVMSAQDDEVKDAGGPREWSEYFESSDKDRLNKYINGEYPWADLAKALTDAPPSEDESEGSSSTSDKIKEGLKSFGKGLGGGAVSVLGGELYDADEGKWNVFPQFKKIFNIDGEAGPRSVASVDAKGGIMFSGTKGATLRVSEDTSKWESHPNGAYAGTLSRWLESHADMI